MLITVDEHALGGHFGHDGNGTGHGWQNKPDTYPDAYGNCPVDEEPTPS